MKKLLLILGTIVYPIIAFCQPNYFNASLIYENPEMTTITYSAFEYHDTLKAYLFTPNNKDSEVKYPCVIITSAFETMNKPIQAKPLRDWGKLLATHGLATIIYEVNNPVDDFDKLIEFINKSANDINIDNDKLALWSFSGHTPLGISKVNSIDQFLCHIIYYGIAFTSESKYKEEVANMSNRFGFKYVTDSAYSSTTPSFIVRAGNDDWKLVLNTTDEFINLLLSKNLQFELVNYAEGQHSFDVYDNTKESERIILYTVDYLKRTLN